MTTVILINVPRKSCVFNTVMLTLVQHVKHGVLRLRFHGKTNADGNEHAMAALNALVSSSSF